MRTKLDYKRFKEADKRGYDILNGNFDGDWRNIITARLYNEKDEDVGSLYDLHFKYMTDNNKLVGERNWI